MRKKIAILGSTGSIGKSTLDVIARHPDRFEVVGLAAGSNIETLAQQMLHFRPRIVSVRDEQACNQLRQRVDLRDVELVWGRESACRVAAYEPADLVVSAIVGAAGLPPTLAAIDAGKTLALANKEALVVAGQLVTQLAKKRKVTILPIDSEHSAIHQSLRGQRREDLQRILLTASGGPFRTKPFSELQRVTVEEALQHPNWSMGEKITIDSATMMNKGLEVIEATWLFDLPASAIDVVVHPQSIVHSMVEYRDGCLLAQLSVPDMRAPIAYALSYPERIDAGIPSLDFTAIAALTFEPADRKRFPCLQLAFDALQAGASMPAVLNAANEVAVAAFLQKRIAFLDIPNIIQKAMEQHTPRSVSSVDEILDIDEQARATARQLVNGTSTWASSLS